VSLKTVVKLMSCGQVSFIFALLVGSAFAALCDTDSGISGIGKGISLVDSLKISVIGFSAKVSYLYLPPSKCSRLQQLASFVCRCSLALILVFTDADPFLKITGASEEPSITIEDGVLKISTDTCAAEEEPPADDTSSAIPIMAGLMSQLLAPRGMGTLVLIASVLGSLTGVYGEGQHSCTPTLEIEISLPIATASITTKFGETDHYLAATTETVTWGYYDPNATAQISMESGETITVEVITHHSSHDYAKMIRGDEAVEEIFAWAEGQAGEDKDEPKLPGSGVHLITGPIEVVGAEPSDIIQVDILELDPRLNPATGKYYGTNSQKFAGYHYRADGGTKRDGTPYTRLGGTEAITVLEFLETTEGDMIHGKPVYMYRFPNMTAPDGSVRTFDNNPAVVIPHEYNHGYSGELIEPDPIVYPEGFDAISVSISTRLGLIAKKSIIGD
jgi:hypothetical protein